MMMNGDLCGEIQMAKRAKITNDTFLAKSLQQFKGIDPPLLQPLKPDKKELV